MAAWLDKINLTIVWISKVDLLRATVRKFQKEVSKGSQLFLKMEVAVMKMEVEVVKMDLCSFLKMRVGVLKMEVAVVKMEVVKMKAML